MIIPVDGSDLVEKSAPRGPKHRHQLGIIP